MREVLQGRFVDRDQEFSGQLVLDEGFIADVIRAPKEFLPPTVSFPEASTLCFPGFIDLHVHAREDPSRIWTYKEDYTTAIAAARHGGVVRFMDMPNPPLPAVDRDSYDAKKRLAGPSVDLYLGIGPNTDSAGPEFFYKVFMTHSVGDLHFMDYRTLKEALARYEGQKASWHCVEPAVTAKDPRHPPPVAIYTLEQTMELSDTSLMRANI